MSGTQRYDVTITYATDPGMLGRDGRIHPAETGTMKFKGLKGGQVRTLLRKYMDAGEITPMNGLRPFDVHVEPVGWEALQEECARRNGEAIREIQGRTSIGADREGE